MFSNKNNEAGSSTDNIITLGSSATTCEQILPNNCFKKSDMISADAYTTLSVCDSNNVGNNFIRRCLQKNGRNFCLLGIKCMNKASKKKWAHFGNRSYQIQMQ